MSDEHPPLHRLSNCMEVLPKEESNDTETCLALNLQPALQDQINFKRFCSSVILIVSMETSDVLALQWKSMSSIKWVLTLVLFGFSAN